MAIIFDPLNSFIPFLRKFRFQTGVIQVPRRLRTYCSKFWINFISRLHFAKHVYLKLIIWKRFINLKNTLFAKPNLPTRVLASPCGPCYVEKGAVAVFISFVGALNILSGAVGIYRFFFSNFEKKKFNIVYKRKCFKSI